MTITREFIGENEDEVVKLALDTLKITKDQATMEFKKNKSGIFDHKKKDVVLEVTFDEDLLLGNRAMLFIRDILEKMNIDAKIYLLEENDENILIEIESESSSRLIGRNGKNLEALQTIVNVVMNRDAEKWTKVVIDIGNYRSKKEKRLQSLAIEAAKKVRKTQRPVLLEPMNPFERRIVHMTLKRERFIETVSEGEGTIKRVRVVYNSDKEEA